MNMNKRVFLKGTATGAALAAGSAFGLASAAANADSCGRVARPATFVLVPGAWCGAFVYDEVAAILRGRGHRVFAVTLTGLAERSHLMSRDITLTTHIDDIVNLIRFHELEHVVLAGHSYGGAPITGAADRVAERISSLVYLDAVVPQDGQTVEELAPGAPGDADPPPGEPPASFPMPPEVQAMFGIPEAERWKYTEMPTGPGRQPLRLTGAVNRIGKKTFVLARRFPGFQATHEALSSNSAWQTVTVDSGHMLMLDDPARTARILEEAA